MSNPIKPSFKTEWLALVLIILGLVAGVYFYQHFPAQVPTHWNVKGEVDGYSRPAIAAFAIPLMMIGMYLLFLFLPYFDPKKDQYASFAGIYHKFKNLVVAFLFLLYFLTGLNGIGYKINIGFYAPIMVGMMFMALGILLEKVKMNWFLGIRTPWTMSSETVWNKTHKLSSWVLIISGFCMAATVLVPVKFRIALFILAVALIVFALPIYSYVLYAQEKKIKK
jgi:uncharacterized membrane protein